MKGTGDMPNFDANFRKALESYLTRDILLSKFEVKDNRGQCIPSSLSRKILSLIAKRLYASKKKK